MNVPRIGGWERNQLPVKIAEPKNFVIENNKAFFTFFKWTGRFALQTDEKGEVRFDIKSPWSIWAIFEMVFYLIFGMFMEYKLVNTLSTLTLRPQVRFISLLFVAFPLLHFANIILLMESKKLAKYLNDWQSFQAQLESLTGKTIKSSCTRTWLVMESICLAINIQFVFINWNNFHDLVHEDGLTEWQLILCLITSPICTHIMVTFPYIFSMYNYLLEEASDILLADIKSLQWAEGSCSLQRHMLLWVQLRQLCVRLGDTFCFSALYMCTGLFLLTLPSLFIGTKACMNGSFTEILASFYTLSMIALMAEMSHRAILVVGPQFEGELNDLLPKIQMVDAQAQLLNFMNSVDVNPPTVSLAGYFNLSRGIIVPMLSSIVTYVVFILENTSDQPQSEE